MSTLTELLKKVPKNDCLVILGDCNEQLPANVSGITGNWVFGETSRNADTLLDMMRMFELFAANTKFRSKKNASTVTYLTSATKGSNIISDQYVGREVTTRYKKTFVKVVVLSIVPCELDIDKNMVSTLSKWLHNTTR